MSSHKRRFFVAEYVVQGKIDRFENVPRNQVRRIVGELLEKLIEGKIKAVHLSDNTSQILDQEDKEADSI